MDLFALGTPVVDVFAKADDKLLKSLGAKKGATAYFSAKRVEQIEKKLKKRLIYRYAGDNARNVCEGFAALGGFCGFQGAVGDDEDASYFAANLQECSISGFLQRKKGSTGKIIALITPDRERTFIADLGVSTKCTRKLGVAAKKSRMFFVGSTTLSGKRDVARLAIEYMEIFKKGKKKVAISLENPPMVAKDRKMLLSIVKKYADVLFLNEDEAKAFLGKNYEKKLLNLKPKIPIFLKKGKSGSQVMLRGRKFSVSALKTNAADTTGAGDAYAAGTLYAMSRGYSVLSCAKMGSYLASKVVQKIGAGVPMRHTRMKVRL